MKIAIYTCITSGYDQLKQIEYVDPHIDYFCFVPKGEKKSDKEGIWQIREFECPVSDSILASRYPKMMPHLFLKDYGYCVYMDANVLITSNDFYDIIQSKIDSGSLFSLIEHPYCDCVYDEAQMILKGGKDTLCHILKAVHFLKSNSFPKHWGLYENNVIFRSHLDKKVISADELWWHLFNKYPKRDQLLLTYCLREYNISRDLLLPPKESTRNSSVLKVEPHNRSKKAKKDSFLCRKLSTFPKFLLRLYISI